MRVKLENMKVGENKDVSYIFGDQLFIGVIKFYRHGHGQITSTHWRMKHKKEFWYKYQDFYIDDSSFDERVDSYQLNDLFVFRPAYVEGRKRAINVVKYRKELHYELALDNILGDNVIHVHEKHRGIIAAGRSGTSETTFETGWDVSIYKSSGVYCHDVFLKCCDNYAQNGREAFMWGIDSFYTKYCDINCRLKENYYSLEEKKELELRTTKAIEHMLSLIDNSTCKKLLVKYPSFQEHAPLSVLKELVGKLDIDYPIPEIIRSENCEKQLMNLIDDKGVFDNYYCDEKRRPKFRRNKIQRLLLHCSEKSAFTLKPIVTQQIKEGIQEYVDQIDNVKSRHEICEFERCCEHYLTEEQHSVILKRLRDGKDLL